MGSYDDNDGDDMRYNDDGQGGRRGSLGGVVLFVLLFVVFFFIWMCKKWRRQAPMRARAPRPIRPQPVQCRYRAQPDVLPVAAQNDAPPPTYDAPNYSPPPAVSFASTAGSGDGEGYNVPTSPPETYRPAGYLSATPTSPQYPPAQRTVLGGGARGMGVGEIFPPPSMPSVDMEGEAPPSYFDLDEGHLGPPRQQIAATEV
jgi:hypothetical protein